MFHSFNWRILGRKVLLSICVPIHLSSAIGHLPSSLQQTRPAAGRRTVLSRSTLPIFRPRIYSFATATRSLPSIQAHLDPLQRSGGRFHPCALTRPRPLAAWVRSLEPSRAEQPAAQRVSLTERKILCMTCSRAILFMIVPYMPIILKQF